MALLTLVYFYREPVWLGKPRRMTLITLIFLAFLLVARLVGGTYDHMIPSLALIPYAFPLSAFGLTIAALFGAPLALVTALPLAILSAYGLPNALDLTLYYLVPGLLGILVLGRARRVASFFWAGAAVAAAGVMVLVAYQFALARNEWVDLIGLAGAAIFNGLATASLTILLQFTLAQLSGMTTAMQLMDLSRPDQPLLQKVLRQAPGTYQHSLQVANLAEQAAERVGADPLLTRVGALYHDSGKAANPYFFIENLLPGVPNPHDSLDPMASAQAIIQHVTDGLELGRKHHLPRRVLEFITEHHGTTIARYQYVKAVKAAGGDESQVDKEAFRYPGPRPQSRETAILMLADGCEARVRAERPKDEADLRSLIKEVVEERAAFGQLDSVSLTLQDLNEIAESFTATLRGIYHPRIIYPTLEASTGIDAITRPTLKPHPALQSPPTESGDSDASHPNEIDPQAQP
jgi:hypothetical protein